MSIATTTTYLVETKYVVDDRRAAGGLQNIGAAADKAAFSTGNLKRHLLAIGTAVVGGSALLAAKNAFIGFNAQVEQSTISLDGRHQAARIVLGAEGEVVFDRGAATLGDAN